MAPVKVALVIAAFFLVRIPPAYGAPIVDTRFNLATGVRGLEVNELILDVRFVFKRFDVSDFPFFGDANKTTTFVDAINMALTSANVGAVLPAGVFAADAGYLVPILTGPSSVGTLVTHFVSAHGGTPPWTFAVHSGSFPYFANNPTTYAVTVSSTPVVPEPSSALLLVLGVTLLTALRAGFFRSLWDNRRL
jgi:hypothetical protein